MSFPSCMRLERRFKTLNNNQFTRFELIESGIFDDYKKERYILKKISLKFKENINLDNINEYPSFCNFDFLWDAFNECRKMYNSISRRKTRVFKKLIFWFYYVSKNTDKKLMFGTLTFRDDVLESTSKATRRRYVSRFLNDNTLHYVANIDYGKKNNREHYHFIALISSRIDKKAWSYGMSNYKLIKTNTSLRNRKNYLLKLTNHTYKDSTKQEKIISDRKEDNSLAVFIRKNYSDFMKYKDEFYLNLLKK